MEPMLLPALSVFATRRTLYAAARRGEELAYGRWLAACERRARAFTAWRAVAGTAAEWAAYRLYSAAVVADMTAWDAYQAAGLVTRTAWDYSHARRLAPAPDADRGVPA